MFALRAPSWPSWLGILLAAFFPWPTLLWSQTSPEHATPAKKSEQAEAAKPKLTPEQERGLRMLKSAEAEAAGLQADMRAFVLWRASYAYAKVDPKKAERIALDAFTATQAIEDAASDDHCAAAGTVGDIKGWIQQSILSDMVTKEEIAEVEQLLPQATDPVRNQITSKLVTYHVKQKNFTKAEALLTQVADSKDYPFGVAADLILAMGPDQSADRMMIFNQAIGNFEEHKQGQSFGSGDIGDFLERTWTKVPSAMALEAVNKLLDEARDNESHARYSMTSNKGSILLNSSYEFRLFQLLPILEQLDKGKADELLRDHAETKAQLAKYPQGMQSLNGDGGVYSYYSTSITDADGTQGREGAARDQAGAQLQQRVESAVKESEKDPAQAVSDALNLPAQGDSRTSPRADALMRIAEGVAKKKPAVAKSALDEVAKLQDQLTPQEMASLSKLPKLYLDIGDADGATKSLRALLKAAENLYSRDTDNDDPNKAFKGTWPSADLWRKCVQAAAQISPALAEQVIAEIPDTDIAGAQKVAFASSLLGISGGPVVVSDCRKHYSGFMMSN